MPYDKAQAAAYQAQQYQSMKSTLQSVMDSYERNPELIAEMLEFKNRFYNYSINNTQLIYDQNPAATYVGSYQKWDQQGYHVRKGQKGIKIFVPIKTQLFQIGEQNGKKQFKKVSDATPEEQEQINSGRLKPFLTTRFTVGNVFDISQTDCPPDDYPKLYHMGYSSDQHAQLYNVVKAYAESKDHPVIEKDLQSIALRGQFFPLTGGIEISDKLNDTEKLSTLTHELGHALLHGVEENKPASVVELEADCISIMLQKELGIDLTDSRKRHFAQHFNKCKEIIKDFKLDEVLKNVNAAYLNLRNELDPMIEQAMAQPEKANENNTNLKVSPTDDKKTISPEATKKTVVVNGFGGPGAGKTTACFDIVSEFKKRGYVADYVPEYATELVWDGNLAMLDGSDENQLALLKEQKHRIDRLIGKVDFVVTDSPLLLNSIYKKDLTPEYENMVLEEYSQYHNFNFVIQRDDSKFTEKGRIHNLSESKIKDKEILDMLSSYNLYYGTYNHEAIDKIINNAIATYNRINQELESSPEPTDKKDVEIASNYRVADQLSEQDLSQNDSIINEKAASAKKENVLAPEQLMEQQLKDLYPTMKMNAGYYILDEVPGYAVGFNPKAPDALVLWSVYENNDYRNGIYRHTLSGFDYRDLVDSGLHVERIEEILSEVGYAYEPLVEEAKSETSQNAQAPLLEQLINGDAFLDDYKQFDLPAEPVKTLSPDQLTEYQNRLGMRDGEFKAWIAAGDEEKPMLLRNICFCRVNNISFPDYATQGLNAAETAPVKPEKSESNPAPKTQTDFKEQDAAVVDYLKRNVSILKVAEDMGFTPQQIGGYYTLKEHDSVRIYPDTNSFHRFSQDVGGSTIDFAMHFGGMNKKEAIQNLKDKYLGDRLDNLPQYVPQPATTVPAEPKMFELPEKAEGKFARAFAYLTKTRCLDADIVQRCMKDGLIYEDNKHNVVFVGTDEAGKPAYATRHTTLTNSDFKRDVAGSRQDLGFMVDNKADKLYVCEAPIDALSIMCLRKQQGQDCNKASYLATCGTGKDIALYNRLKQHSNIKDVVLANDNDEAGQKANRKIYDHLKANYPQIKVSYLKPKGKDINEHLCKFCEGKCTPTAPKKNKIKEVER